MPATQVADSEMRLRCAKSTHSHDAAARRLALAFRLGACHPLRGGRAQILEPLMEVEIEVPEEYQGAAGPYRPPASLAGPCLARSLARSLAV